MQKRFSLERNFKRKNDFRGEKNLRNKQKFNETRSLDNEKERWENKRKKFLEEHGEEIRQYFFPNQPIKKGSEKRKLLNAIAFFIFVYLFSPNISIHEKLDNPQAEEMALEYLETDSGKSLMARFKASNLNVSVNFGNKVRAEEGEDLTERLDRLGTPFVKAEESGNVNEINKAVYACIWKIQILDGLWSNPQKAVFFADKIENLIKDVSPENLPAEFKKSIDALSAEIDSITKPYYEMVKKSGDELKRNLESKKVALEKFFTLNFSKTSAEIFSVNFKNRNNNTHFDIYTEINADGKIIYTAGGSDIKEIPGDKEFKNIQEVENFLSNVLKKQEEIEKLAAKFKEIFFDVSSLRKQIADSKVIEGKVLEATNGLISRNLISMCAPRAIFLKKNGKDLDGVSVMSKNYEQIIPELIKLASEDFCLQEIFNKISKMEEIPSAERESLKKVFISYAIKKAGLIDKNGQESIPPGFGNTVEGYKKILKDFLDGDEGKPFIDLYEEIYHKYEGIKKENATRLKDVEILFYNDIRFSKLDISN